MSGDEWVKKWHEYFGELSKTVEGPILSEDEMDSEDALLEALYDCGAGTEDREHIVEMFMFKLSDHSSSPQKANSMQRKKA